MTERRDFTEDEMANLRFSPDDVANMVIEHGKEDPSSPVEEQLRFIARDRPTFDLEGWLRRWRLAKPLN